ncbi:Mannose-1-phosphate guanylyltransferase RfbM [bioreactor metagenome]|jgi:mannose-1-phosphate guanylyltransferase|uniref:Mannose-1-phosphate guanylyltransferase RfbM n=1 Tax=bioreactor metagenome TaxID=1076179 RepID=A0A644VX90_9ZZZZ
MAGGIGSRFWPVSRNSKPKQFLDILGVGKSFLQQTYERFSKIIDKENIVIVTSSLYKEIVFEQLPGINPENVLLEPYRRNTAPCIAYATYKLLDRNPDATVVVAPSDHLIVNDDEFLGTIKNAIEYASGHNVLLTLGINPSRAETAYGYIQVNKSSKLDIAGNRAYLVKTFTEKPSEELAEVFVKSGEFLWNSGIFVWNLQTIKAELEVHQKGISSMFSKGKGTYYTPAEQEFIKSVYEDCTSISIDYGIMEKTEKAIVYPVSFGWSDLGTWDALYSEAAKDNFGNHIVGDETMVSDVKECIVVTQEKNKLVVLKGLDGYMVINTDDVLLICPRDEAAFKGILTDLPLNEFMKYQ